MDIEAFIAALPKAELHVHLVGAASVDTVLELARRHPLTQVPKDRDELARYYEFTDFPHFINVYSAVNKLVTTPEDVQTMLLGIARDLAANNVRYAELTVSAVAHFRHGIGPDALSEALVAGRKKALAEHGVELAWIFDVPMPSDHREGYSTLEYVLDQWPEGTVGLGLAGLEAPYPRKSFTAAFQEAKAAGLRSLPHAGETTGPEEIWAALRDLGAERIGHGVSATSDAKLLKHLAETGIPLEVSLTSNVCTKAVPSLAEHPLPRLLDAGVTVTLNTDDPGMFGTDLNREYLLCHEVFGLGRSELADLARNAARAAFCSEQTRSRLLEGIDAVERAASEQ
ncbi:adenosine deaminase [Kutzneria kofuensis]|uniref:Aminodeoxyfutalosine deaminase n=1 Tax=Kutzneria kofuensis TaxID=103725 RepID=A0A7W9KKZ5_9PSEU|nr:adenosine deaminase [Kutzneria kofuensis]MBB5894465.1 aminodeoxyfutalosine deaminase [Kutzneria kofuensis]